MTIYNVSTTGTKTTGDSVLNDWSNGDTYNISSLSTVLRTAMEAGDGNEVVIDDGSYEFTSTVLACSGWASSSNKLFIKARTDAVTLEMNSSNRFAIINNSSALFKFEFVNIYVGRAASFNHTLNTTGATLFTIAGSPDSIIFRGGGISRAHINVDSMSGGMGLTHSISGSNTRSIEFIDYDRRNLSITQTVGAGNINNGVIGSVYCKGNNTTLKYSGVTTTDVTITNDIVSKGIDFIEFGNVELNGDVTYSNITANGDNSVNSGLSSCMQARVDITQAYDATFLVENVSLDSRNSGVFGLRVENTHQLEGKIHGKNCKSSSYSNSVGGLFLALSSSAQGTVGDILAEDCAAPFGTAYDLSDGGSSHARSVTALRCRNLGAAVYKGGDGDGVIDSCTVVGNMKFPENPHQPNAAEKERVVYGHQHSSTSTRNGSLTIGTLYLEDNGDSVTGDDEYLVQARNPNTTYTFTMTIGTLIVAESVDMRKVSNVLDIGSAGVSLTIDNKIIMPAPPKQYLMIAPGISVPS